MVQLVEAQVIDSDLAPKNLRGTVGLLGYIHPMFHLDHGDNFAKYDDHNPWQHGHNAKKRDATAQRRRLTSPVSLNPEHTRLFDYAQRRKLEIAEDFAEGGPARWWTSRKAQRSHAREAWRAHNNTAKSGGTLIAALERARSRRWRPSMMTDAEASSQASMWKAWRKARSGAPLSVLRGHTMWHSIENAKPCLRQPDPVRSTEDMDEEACRILQAHGFV